MSFTIAKAQKSKVKLKLGLFGPSGSGKTMSSLKLAYGITKDWTKICVIDTENGSASLYSDLGEYSVINFESPFSPDRYIEAIGVVEKEGFEVLIMDSISHEWNGKGGILDIKEKMSGNDFIKWSKLTPLHNSFREAILQSNIHVIVTGRTKEEYQLVENSNGKMAPEKMGTGIIQRDGVEYELTVAFGIDIKHNASATKDRTSMFSSTIPFTIDESIGEGLIERANKGIEAIKVDKESEAMIQFKEAISKSLTKDDSEAAKGALKVRVNKSDKLNDNQKEQLLEYINNFSNDILG